MGGQCRSPPGLAATAIEPEARLPTVPARGGEALVRRLLEPLGYAVDVQAIGLDEQHPDWGDSRHVGLRLTATRGGRRRGRLEPRARYRGPPAQAPRAPRRSPRAHPPAAEPATYRDKRLRGFDAVALVEVTEHRDPPRLAAAEANVFADAQPATVIVTTPNAEYNPRWETLPAGRFRHPDHRFEWTRGEFATWAQGVARRHGYEVRYLPVGPDDPQVGPPTQMAVFSR